ncbi:MAG: hypothetical protein ABIH57_02600 [Candidatus Omnitrophota bacterium]
MVFKKMLYMFFGCVVGFMIASFLFAPDSMAQFGSGSSSFKVVEMEAPVPASYGKLIAVSGLYLYLQAENGTIYIIKQHSVSQFDPNITVIKRN